VAEKIENSPRVTRFWLALLAISKLTVNIHAYKNFIMKHVRHHKLHSCDTNRVSEFDKNGNK